MLLKHEGIKIYNCELCEKSFTFASGLKNHLGLKIHLEKVKERAMVQSELSCRFCKNRFDQQEDLKQHMHQNECNAMKDHVMKLSKRHISEVHE